MLLADAVLQQCDGDAADGGAGSSTPLGHPRRWVILHAAGHPRRLVATRRLVIQAAAWSPRRLVSTPLGLRAVLDQKDTLAAQTRRAREDVTP